MLILKSNEYKAGRYCPDLNLWEFERIASPKDPDHREFLRTSDGKYVDKATDTVTMFGQNGVTVVTTLAGIKQV